MSQLLTTEDLAFYKNEKAVTISAAVWGEYNDHGRIRRDLDQLARDKFMSEDVAPKVKSFSAHTSSKKYLDRLQWLVENDYYERPFLDNYSKSFLEEIFVYAYSFNFKFDSFAAAAQFYATGSMRTLDHNQYLETFEDRTVAVALLLGNGDEGAAKDIVRAILEGEYQPATPTWMNAGRKKRGEYVSCFLLNTDDSLIHIFRNLMSEAMLSKAGGGVAICLSNVRGEGAPIKGYKGRAANIIHIVKLMERIAAYANQLGTRKGAAVAWFNILHWDALTLIDARKIRQNADEDFKLKTVNLGLVIPDIVMEKAAKDEDIQFFDPYDVKRVLGKDWTQIDISEHYEYLANHPDVRKDPDKVINARDLFQEVSELNAQSGQPFILFEGNANRNAPIKGRVSYSNLCSEILQISRLPKVEEDGSYSDEGEDINCVLGSLITYRLMHNGNFAKTVDTALRSLCVVSETANFSIVPSLKNGNDHGHPVGLGVMDYSAFLGSEKITFGSQLSKEFTDMFFRTLKYYTLKTNNEIAKEKGTTFTDFEESGYADGSHLKQYIDFKSNYSKRIYELTEKFNIPVPTKEDWEELDQSIRKYGLYMRYTTAIAPTGNISYVRNSSASIAPINAMVEYRRTGTTGSFYHLAPHVTEETEKYFVTAYDVDYKDFIDVYAAATPHVDQGISMTIYEPLNNNDSMWYNAARVYAWRKGIKTIYYVRVNNNNERPDNKDSEFQQVKDKDLKKVAKDAIKNEELASKRKKELFTEEDSGCEGCKM